MPLHTSTLPDGRLLVQIVLAPGDPEYARWAQLAHRNGCHKATAGTGLMPGAAFVKASPAPGVMLGTTSADTAVAGEDDTDDESPGSRQGEEDLGGLARLFADVFNSLEAAGQEIGDDDVEGANDDLQGSGWAVERAESGEWVAVEEELVEEIELAGSGGTRAPKGGISIAGRFFKGGQWIPGKAIDHASEADKERLAEAKAHGEALTADREKTRKSRGSVDTHALRNRLAKHADRHELTADERRGAATSARMIHRHHGELAAHRLEELADRLERALDSVPEENEGLRKNIGRQLAQLHLALGHVRDKGVTGEVKGEEGNSADSAAASEPGTSSPDVTGGGAGEDDVYEMPKETTPPKVPGRYEVGQTVNWDSRTGPTDAEYRGKQYGLDGWEATLIVRPDDAPPYQITVPLSKVGHPLEKEAPKAVERPVAKPIAVTPSPASQPASVAAPSSADWRAELKGQPLWQRVEAYRAKEPHELTADEYESLKKFDHDDTGKDDKTFLSGGTRGGDSRGQYKKQYEQHLRKQWEQARDEAFAAGKPVAEKPRWAMSAEEYDKKTGGGEGERRSEIEAAVAAGKPVPPAIVAEYRSLAAKAAAAEEAEWDAPTPPSPGFTGIDANGHQWLDGENEMPKTPTAAGAAPVAPPAPPPAPTPPATSGETPTVPKGATTIAVAKPYSSTSPPKVDLAAHGAMFAAIKRQGGPKAMPGEEVAGAYAAGKKAVEDHLAAHPEDRARAGGMAADFMRAEADLSTLMRRAIQSAGHSGVAGDSHHYGEDFHRVRGMLAAWMSAWDGDDAAPATGDPQAPATPPPAAAPPPSPPATSGGGSVAGVATPAAPPAIPTKKVQTSRGERTAHTFEPDQKFWSARRAGNIPANVTVRKNDRTGEWEATVWGADEGEIRGTLERMGRLPKASAPAPVAPPAAPAPGTSPPDVPPASGPTTPASPPPPQPPAPPPAPIRPRKALPPDAGKPDALTLNQQHGYSGKMGNKVYVAELSDVNGGDFSRDFVQGKAKDRNAMFQARRKGRGTWDEEYAMQPWRAYETSDYNGRQTVALLPSIASPGEMAHVDIARPDLHAVMTRLKKQPTASFDLGDVMKRYAEIAHHEGEWDRATLQAALDDLEAEKAAEGEELARRMNAGGA